MSVTGIDIEDALAITKVLMRHHKIDALRQMARLQDAATRAAVLIVGEKFIETKSNEIICIADSVIHRLIKEQTTEKAT